MGKHTRTKHLCARLCAGAVLCTAISLASITASAKFLTTSKNNKTVEKHMTGCYVTDRQMELAIPAKDVNESALYNCLQKARNGKSITAAFIGGSITKGTISDKTAVCSITKKQPYISYFTNWWQDKFPDAGLNVINAGLSATDSYLGVHRVKKDVLDQNPDLVIVEFAVNDQPAEFYKQTYENLVRKILAADSKPAVLLLFMSRTNGVNCQAQQIQVGKHYHLPMLSYGNVMADMISRGAYTAEELSGDGIHPSSLGSAIAGEILTNYLESLCGKQPNQVMARTFPSDYLTSEEYPNAEVISCKDLNITNMGTFHAANKSNFFHGNLACSSGDGGLEFTITCRSLGFLFVSDKSGNGGQFDIYIDGRKTAEINADNKGARVNQPKAVPCFYSSRTAVHTVRITKQKNSSGSRLILYAVLISK